MTTEIDITPAHLRCSIGGCPSVHLLDDGRVLIVGETAFGGDASMHLVQIAKILETVGRLESAVIVSPDILSDLPELTRLRKENEILGGALVEISGHADLGGPWCAAKARLALEGLGCQASGLQGGEAVSPTALHLGAGGEAEEWAECGFGICGDCGAGLIDDAPCLRCKWQERRAMGKAVWRPCDCHKHEQQVCDLCQGVPKRIQRPDEERASAMSANSEHIASLTPIKTHENPPRTAEDQSTAIAQPPEVFADPEPTSQVTA